MAHFCVYWLPVLVWMGLIFVMSTSRFSMARTKRFVEPLLKLLFRRLSGERLTLAHTRIREGAHFAEYMVLSALVFRALRGDDPALWQWQWMVASILVTSAYGFADELHQRWEKGRTAKLRHALIDVGGAVVAQAVILLGVCLLR